MLGWMLLGMGIALMGPLRAAGRPERIAAARAATESTLFQVLAGGWLLGTVVLAFGGAPFVSRLKEADGAWRGRTLTRERTPGGAPAPARPVPSRDRPASRGQIRLTQLGGVAFALVGLGLIGEEGLYAAYGRPALARPAEADPHGRGGCLYAIDVGEGTRTFPDLCGMEDLRARDVPGFPALSRLDRASPGGRIGLGLVFVAIGGACVASATVEPRSGRRRRA